MSLGFTSGNRCHDLILVEIVSLELTDDLAVTHDYKARARTDHLVYFGRNECNALSFRSKFQYEFLYLDFCSDIDTSCRFVENKILGVSKKPSCEDNFLLVAA